FGRKVFKLSLIGQMLRDAFARRERPEDKRRAPRSLAVQAPRRQGFMLEPLEPRLLLSADLSYTPAISNPLATEFTLKAVSPTALNLYDTSNNVVGSATLSDGTVNIERSLLGDVTGDTIHLAVDTFTALDASSSGITGNSDSLSIVFKGGDQRLVPDDVKLDDSTAASLGFGLSVTSNSKIDVSGTISVTGNLSLTSEQTGIGGALYSGEGLLANSNTGITLAGANLTASGDLTLDSHSNLSVNTSGAETGTASGTGTAADGIAGVSLVTSFNSAKIDIGNSVLTATSGNMKISSLVDGSLSGSATANSIGLDIAVLFGESDPEVLIHGALTSLNAGGTLDASATSNMTTSAVTSPTSSDSSHDSSFGAAVVVTAFDSEALLGVSDSAQVHATGAATLTASNTLSATSNADGSVGSKAGASVAVSVIFGDTAASVQDATVGGSSVSVGATSKHTITTSATSTPGGASSTSGSSSQGEKTLASNNASTGSGQNISVAGAIAVNTDTGTTKAYLDGATIDAGTGTATVSAGSTDVVKLTADGSNTGSTKGTTTDGTSDGVGVAVAIDVADLNDLAYVTGSTTVTAGSLQIEVLAPAASSFDTEATSGVGSASNVGFAGALALNVVVTEHEAYLDQNATLTLNGATDITIQATSNVTNTVKSVASDGGGVSTKVGIGASVAFNYGEDTTAAYLGDDAGFAGSGSVHNLTLTAGSTHEMTTVATGGGAGSTAVTPVVAISVADDDTHATLGAGGLLSIGGNFGATSTLADNVAT
ncbi:MAG: beta strand repeat-containing protein, partial [Mycobacterium sp.]